MFWQAAEIRIANLRITEFPIRGDEEEVLSGHIELCSGDAGLPQERAAKIVRQTNVLEPHEAVLLDEGTSIDK